MAYSNWTGVSDGSTVDFTVPFPYLDQSHVHFSVNGVDVTFTWSTGTTIKLDAVPAEGDDLRLYRSTSPGSTLVDFTSGFLPPEDLNTAYLHSFYLSEEALDRAGEFVGLASDTGWDAQSKRLENLSDPTAPQDAATKAYVDTTTAAAVAEADSAAASAGASKTAAAASATAAQSSEASAENAATRAASSAASTNLPDLSGASGLEMLRLKSGKSGYELRTDAQVLADIKGARASSVLMVHTSPSVWAVYLPDGSVLDVTGTTTQGLQEAINYASAHGYALNVVGGPVTDGGTVDHARITCTTGLKVPTAEKAHYHLDAVSLLIQPTTASDDGILFDSLDMADFVCTGQIIYVGTGAAVHLNPQNDNGENFTGATSSTIDIRTIALVNSSDLQPQSTAGVGFLVSPTKGPVINCTFKIGEVNGGLTGIQIEAPPTGMSFQGNYVYAPAVHTQGDISVAIGGADDPQGRIFGNIWDLILSPTGASSQALNTWAQYDIYRLSITSGNIGIVTNTGTSRCSFTVAKNAATTPVSDSSTNKDNSGIGGEFYPAALVNLNGTDQTGVVSGTLTKVNFNNVGYDHGKAFDTTNHRWVPGRVGIAYIAARASWNGVVANTQIAILIYKNGSVYLQNIIAAGGTQGDQGPWIGVNVEVSDPTDYFEIFVQQNTGANQDINGNTSLTWATFRMVRN